MRPRTCGSVRLLYDLVVATYFPSRSIPLDGRKWVQVHPKDTCWRDRRRRMHGDRHDSSVRADSLWGVFRSAAGFQTRAPPPPPPPPTPESSSSQIRLGRCPAAVAAQQAADHSPQPHSHRTRQDGGPCLPMESAGSLATTRRGADGRASRGRGLGSTRFEP